MKCLPSSAPLCQADTDVTVFDSTGLGLHDVVVADTACRLALEVGRRYKVRFLTDSGSSSSLCA